MQYFQLKLCQVKIKRHTHQAELRIRWGLKVVISVEGLGVDILIKLIDEHSYTIILVLHV